MAVQPECRVCGNYVWSGPVLCEDCATDVTARLAAVTTERDAALAEAKKLRVERDTIASLYADAQEDRDEFRAVTAERDRLRDELDHANGEQAGLMAERDRLALLADERHDALENERRKNDTLRALLATIKAELPGLLRDWGLALARSGYLGYGDAAITWAERLEKEG